MIQLGNDWDGLLADEFKQPYYLELREFLKQQYGSKQVYPDMYDLFNALKYTSYEAAKVVILGQDPYHGRGQAHGLSFSVQKGIRIPPSLENIFQELKNDLGCFIPNNGYLKPWTDQGVLLLNTVLTVEAGKANSHKGQGWENLTDAVIRLLNQKEAPLVFILWGNNAKQKTALLNNPNHLILTSSHPSPYSANYGFFGSKPFSKTNDYLVLHGEAPIDWQIPNLYEKA
ncbi:uracil-DNA glycosylase [Listeria floridensis FSL S10-1187]|uniref:Uracil-DNA glycosylase n=1 Tax=Listeria floridensis FSL S10-1187 TaxID=1265817 RepID=A0ABN0RCM1_9LIST|nr:uracil-DNA glycosylase [Listeria floridensis]EUJ27418.1 uracil-DNA glycosylase [Listeria floridensis FSL S10-1187]